MLIKSNNAQHSKDEKNAMPTSSAIATVEGALASVSNDFHTFVDDVDHLIKEASSLGGEELDRAREKLSERIATARDLVERKGNSLTKQARKSVAAGNKYVHQQPWQIVGAGAALGLLIGLALVRRR